MAYQSNLHIVVHNNNEVNLAKFGDAKLILPMRPVRQRRMNFAAYSFQPKSLSVRNFKDQRQCKLTVADSKSHNG